MRDEWKSLLNVLVLATCANGLLHLVVTFETAQHRFHTLWPCLLGAVGYVAGVHRFAHDLQAATRFYAACNAFACLGTLAGSAYFLWFRPTAGGTPSPSPSPP